MTIATIDDVEVSLLRSLTTVESEYAPAILARAEGLLITRVPDLIERVAASAAFSSAVITIEADAVARVFRNPTGMRQEADGTYSYSVNVMVASGLLDILDAEWARLGIDSNAISSSAGAMDGYARARYGTINPSWWFQNGWPANEPPV